MKRFKVSYKGVEHEVNAGLKAAFIFENLSGKAFEIKTSFDAYLYAYAILWTSEAFKEQWDDFVAFCDDNAGFIDGIFKAIPKAGNVQAPAEK